MPLHIPIAAGARITTYAMEGTGDITCPHEVDTVLEGMTKTINDMESGDVVLLDFDCTVKQTIIERGEIVFRIKVNSVQIGRRTECVTYGTAGAILFPVSLVRRYEVPADGDYTFTVTWYWSDPYGTPSYPPEINDGLRTLTILQIRSG